MGYPPQAVPAHFGPVRFVLVHSAAVAVSVAATAIHAAKPEDLYHRLEAVFLGHTDSSGV